MEDKKMKTITYNPHREIMTAIFVLIISFTALTTVRAQGTLVRSNGKSLMASLSKEKTVKSADISLAKYTASDNSLAMKIKSWMNTGSYWNRTDDEVTIVSQLAQTFVSWMSNGSYWSTSLRKEIERDDLALAPKEEMTCDALVMDDK